MAGGSRRVERNGIGRVERCGSRRVRDCGSGQRGGGKRARKGEGCVLLIPRKYLTSLAATQEPGYVHNSSRPTSFGAFLFR